MSAEDSAGARSFAGLGVVDAISMVVGSVVTKVELPDLRGGPHLTKVKHTANLLTFLRVPFSGLVAV